MILTDQMVGPLGLGPTNEYQELGNDKDAKVSLSINSIGAVNTDCLGSIHYAWPLSPAAN